jgi:hypothetical protein
MSYKDDLKKLIDRADEKSLTFECHCDTHEITPFGSGEKHFIRDDYASVVIRFKYKLDDQKARPEVAPEAE